MDKEIIELSRAGYAIEDIAEELGISESMVLDVLEDAGEL